MGTTESPVLTKKEDKLTASTKKRKLGRELFASPYKLYWPILNEDDVEDFNQFLLRTLKPAFKRETKVAWSVLRETPKNMRRTVRKEMVLRSTGGIGSDDEAEKLRRCLYLGVNAVARGLKSASISAALVASDAPKILIKHIVDMCGIQRIPVLAVPTLRQITKSGLGFSCICVAVKKEAADIFKELCETISRISSKILVPEHLLSYSESIDQKPTSREVKKHCEQKSKLFNISDVYKYRNSKKERAFVPGLITVTASRPSTDFLSFSKDVTDPKEGSVTVVASNPSSNFLSFSLDETKPKTSGLLTVPASQPSSAFSLNVGQESMTSFKIYKPLQLKRTIPDPNKIKKKALKKTIKKKK